MTDTQPTPQPRAPRMPWRVTLAGWLVKREVGRQFRRHRIDIAISVGDSITVTTKDTQGEPANIDAGYWQARGRNIVGDT